MTKTKLATVGLLAALAVLGTALPASAADKDQKGVITLREIEIVGRVQKPIAAVDVGKIPLKVTLTELRQPFLDRIEEATLHDPF
jgi:hypothetical protein